MQYLLDFLDRLSVRFTVWNWHRNKAILNNARKKKAQ